MKKIKVNSKDNGKISGTINYKKSRLIVFIILIVTLLSISIGYSANLSSILYMLGYVNLDIEEGNIEISNVSDVSSTYVTDSNYSVDGYSGSADNEYIVALKSNITYRRTVGSSTPNIVYDIVITNNTLKKQTLSKIDLNASFIQGSSTLEYSVSGVNEGATIIGPRQSVTARVTLSLSNNDRGVIYQVDNILEFIFVSDSRFEFTPFLQTRNVNFNTENDLAKVNIYVANNVNSDVVYNVSSANKNFEVVDSEGNPISNFTASPKSNETISVYLKIADEHLFISNNDDAVLLLNVVSPVILTYDLGSVSATIPTFGAQRILGNKTINDDSTIDFTASVTTSGVFENVASGETTYFYRGDVKDNYVSFAGLTWRIIKIDRKGTKLILDDVIADTAAWASSNSLTDTSTGTGTDTDTGTTSNTLENAIVRLSYDNSLVKPKLDSWYVSNLEAYGDIIKPTVFCQDFNYQTKTSSGSNNTTYYFGTYVRVGLDSNEYTPEFSCPSEYVIKANVGLISGDEMSFAGAVFEHNSTNYYLYNSNIKGIWWTMSPSYYDPTLKTVGSFVVDGSNGKLYDWQNGNTIANSNYIRPVITVDTDRLSGGSGTSDDPYTFS